MTYLCEDGNQLILEAVPRHLSAEDLAALLGSRPFPIRGRAAVDPLPVPLHDRHAGLVGEVEEALVGGPLVDVGDDAGRGEEVQCGGMMLGVPVFKVSWNDGTLGK